MAFQTLVCGLMLAVVGAFGYLNADLNEEGKKPITALIPLWFGVALCLCAMIVFVKESARKHVMHLAALIGLIGIIGGLMPLYRQLYVKNLPFDPAAPPVRNGLLMSAICLLFVGLCVMSFVNARKNRQ